MVKSKFLENQKRQKQKNHWIHIPTWLQLTEAECLRSPIEKLLSAASCRPTQSTSNIYLPLLWFLCLVPYSKFQKMLISLVKLRR